MAYKEMIKRAFGTFDSNALIYNNGTNAEGARINPIVWDARLREFQEKLLVIAPLGEQFDFTGPGSDYRVTIDTVPTAISSGLTETVAVPVTAQVSRQVTFTPSEQGASFEMSYAEAARALFDMESRFMRKLGYLLAERKDSVCYTTLNSGATTTVFSNSKADAAALATTDTLSLSDVTRAVRAIENLLYVPDVLLINPTQKQMLMTDSSIIKLLDASQFGTRQAIANGLLGELYGLRVFLSHSIPTTGTNRANALVLGRTRSGEPAFGVAQKRAPRMETDRHIGLRQIQVVATEEYDVKVLHADAIAVIMSGA